MLVAPEVILEEYKEKEYIDLIDVRNKIIRRIKEYESIYVFKTRKPKEIEIEICPGPDVQYLWDCELLGLISKLINEKYHDYKAKSNY